MSFSPKMTPSSPFHSAIANEYVHVRTFADPVHERTLVVVEVYVLDEEVPLVANARENNHNVIRAALAKAGTHVDEPKTKKSHACTCHLNGVVPSFKGGMCERCLGMDPSVMR